MNPFSSHNTEEEESIGPAINEPPKATQEFELSVISKGDGHSDVVAIHDAGKESAEFNGRFILADRSLCESLEEVR